MDNPLVVIGAIGAVVVLAMLLPRWIRRSSDSTGRRAGRRFEQERLLEILDVLGTTLVLEASESTASEVVDTVVRRDPRRFTVLDDLGGYGIRFLEADDAVAVLAPVEQGMRLQIDRFREYLGRPNTAGFWADLRARAEAEARYRGIATATGASLRYERVTGEEPVWTRIDPDTAT